MPKTALEAIHLDPLYFVFRESTTTYSAAIITISETIGLVSLPDSLREVAEIRLNNPQATLAEIAEILGNKITRAAISLRLKKLIKLAQTLGENDGE